MLLGGFLPIHSRAPLPRYSLLGEAQSQCNQLHMIAAISYVSDDYALPVLDSILAKTEISLP